MVEDMGQMNGMRAQGTSREINPFSATAVARVTELDDDTVTIQTPAFRDAYQLLDRYLSGLDDPSGSAGRQGHVVMIAGEYGTGKTHLAVKLLQRARQTGDGQVFARYLEAPADTFVALYRRFTTGLRRADVIERVRDYYADVVAESLADSQLTADVARGLRDGELEPVGIVSRLSLDKGALQRRLQDRLHAVTRNAAFATALTLLLEPDFEELIWDWLTGKEPEPVLVERGIIQATETEEDVLEAMGVLALLYGRADRRFVLVIDELDKILLAFSRPTPAAQVAFKKMLEVFTHAGAFLVLAGLRDVLQVFGEDVRDRIARVVQMTPLTAEQVRRFIRDSQQRIVGSPQLAPFTDDTVDYLVNLANGNARRIIRLCYHLYRRATDERTDVTDAMVRDVARTHFDFATVEDVRREIRRVLDKEGIPYLRNHVVGSLRDGPVDYWIPIADRNAGCGVLLTESILSRGEVGELVGRAAAIGRSVPDSDVLVVVVGYLPAELSAAFVEAIETEPIVYDRLSFGEDFAAAIKAVLRGLNALAGADALGVVRERIERLNRQQSNTQSFIEQLIGHLDTMRTSTERQFGSIQRELDEISQHLANRWDEPATQGDAPVARRTPPEVSRLFTEALGALGELTAVDDLLQAAFAPDQGSAAEIADARKAVRGRLRQPDFLVLLGFAVMLRRLVETFRDAVEEWHRTYTMDGRDRLRRADEERLNSLCHTYDAIYEYLPLYRLDALAELTARPGAEDSRVVEISRLVRRRDLRQMLDGLGARVRGAVLASIHPTAA